MQTGRAKSATELLASDKIQCHCIENYLSNMTNMNPADLERLTTFAMPYGKYKGRVIADLPGNYLNWFAREGFPAGELGRLLALMQKIDHNGLSHLLKPLRQQPSTWR